MEFTRKGITGIKGFINEVQTESVRFRSEMIFPNMSAMGQWTSNIVTVGRSGEMFPVIQEAIDSIRDASETNPYVLMISGGVYQETLTLPGWIHLWGSGDVMLNPGDVPTITFTGGMTWVFAIRVLPETGTFPAFICTNANLNLFRTAFRRGMIASGDCTMYFDFVETGPLIHTNGTLDVRTSSAYFYGGILRSGAGEIILRLVSTLVYGLMIISDAKYTLQFHNTWILNPVDGQPAIYLDPVDVDSYLRLQSCLLSAQNIMPTIARNALAGTVQVWSMQNAMSGAFGPNVNDNITTPYNVIDAEIANFRS